jgi:hypothetical protein
MRGKLRKERACQRTQIITRAKLGFELEMDACRIILRRWCAAPSTPKMDVFSIGLLRDAPLNYDDTSSNQPCASRAT